jgi:hypothetical protein
MEQAGEAAVGEDATCGLAAGAVVGFVVRVADTENLFAAARARLAVATVNGHPLAECGDFFGEGGGGAGVEAIDPEAEGLLGGGEEAQPVIGAEFLREGGGGELGGVEDLVGVGVADAAEQALVGESALEGAVLAGERGAEGVEIGGEGIEATGIERAKGFFSADEVERSAPLGAGLGEDQRAAGEIEGGEVAAAGELAVRPLPVEAASDHEVKDEPEIVIETEGNPLGETAEFADGAAVDGGERRIDGAQEESAVQADTLKRLVENAGPKGGEVGGDVGEFGHRGQSAWRRSGLARGEGCRQVAGAPRASLLEGS